MRQLRSWHFGYRRWPTAILVVTLTFSVRLAADAQPPGKVPRIGFLGVGSPAAFATPVAAFRHGLRDLGYVEGQNVGMESRWAEGREARLPALAAELVRLDLDVILTHGAGISAVKQATTTPRHGRLGRPGGDWARGQLGPARWDYYRADRPRPPRAWRETPAAPQRGRSWGLPRGRTLESGESNFRRH